MPTSERMRGTADAELVRLVFALTDQLQLRFEAVAAQHGLTRQQATLLGLLEQSHPMSVLAEILHCDASNVTGLVSRLERQGLVQRERHDKDRRVTLVSATAAGRDLYSRFEDELYGGELPFARLTATQRTTLRTLLDRLV
ncbi:MAG: MarR family winged helix-turn-helix transcriptional regulator [Motilibacteraceae bacterium]